MKKLPQITWTYLSILLILFQLENAQSKSSTVTNHLDIPRGNEIISIPSAALLRFIPANRLNQASIREQGQNTYLRTQLIDNELDGEMDELLFLASFQPGETKTFVIEAVE